jgi:hypothetical protein
MICNSQANGVPCPCKNCQDRHSECHSTCPKYKKYEKKNKEARERIAKETFKHNCVYR